MRNPTVNIPPTAKYVTGHLHRFADLNSLQLHPHSLIDAPNATRDESVEAKWEQIQQYEARENPSLSSLASSTASNSTTSTNTGTSSNTNSANDKLRSKLRKLKQQSLKKLSGFKLWSKNSQHQQQNSGVPEIASEVNTVPNGSLTMSKLRASKSMQNLEQITRDSFYNLKDLSSNLRQKYNSRMELRQQSQMYNELWDDDEENEDICYRRNYDDY